MKYGHGKPFIIGKQKEKTMEDLRDNAARTISYGDAIRGKNFGLFDVIEEEKNQNDKSHINEFFERMKN